MRFVYWSPPSTDETHASGFTTAVLSRLSTHGEIVHVVAGGNDFDPRTCDLAPTCTSPIALVREPGDVVIYEIDNAANCHAIYAEALRNPGVLLLRDAFLPELLSFLCGGEHSEMYHQEIRYSEAGMLPSIDEEQPLFARRLVDASAATLVLDPTQAPPLVKLAPMARLRALGDDGQTAADGGPVIARMLSELAGEMVHDALDGKVFTPRYSLIPQVAANAIGSWFATTGLAEAGRRSVSALLDQRVSVSLEVCDLGAPTNANRFPDRFHELQRGRPNPIELCFLNINEFDSLSDEYLRRDRKGSYLIGSWYWELPFLPSNLVRHARRVNEIWVASKFVADTMSGYTSAPIHIFPGMIAPEHDASLTRKDFDLPENECLFVFNFDAQSTFARKNPWGAIEAFRKAFGTKSQSVGARLVMKTINLDKTPEGRIELRHAVEQVGGILIEENFQPQEMASFIALSDVYVSLHRSEGFGMGMAEAMYFGKPVIATAYSGNEDFTNIGTACPVGYTLVPVTEGDLRFNPSYERVYEPGQMWASPDLDQAASWMRYLLEHPSERQRIGNAGSQLVRDKFSSHSVGAAMRQRLSEISASLV